MRSEGALKHYQSKRDFRHTPEPRGKIAKSTRNRFVVQKHAARRLHFDFRLELDGVLKSWAVTRGPSLNPSDKRLAVRTEDHPIEYGGFEGVIPKGYGAGTVMLWDRGQWLPLEDPQKGLKKGVLKFTLKGERLQGQFTLVRMKTENEKKENWLLIKQHDQFSSDDIDPVETWDTSVKSQRTLQDIASQGENYQPSKHYSPGKAASGTVAGKPGKSRKYTPLQFIPPQLATLRAQPPTGEEWLHEVKYDGYRIQAMVERGSVRLLTRNKKDWTDRYPGIVRAAAQLKVDSAILDGELVALDKRGASSSPPCNMRPMTVPCNLPTTYSICCTSTANHCSGCHCSSARRSCTRWSVTDPVLSTTAITFAAMASES